MELYRATLGGERILLVPGRLERLTLPRRLERAEAERSRACFFCGADDPLDRGSLGVGGDWWIWGNAFPVVARAHLLARRGPEYHSESPLDLTADDWQRLTDRVFGDEVHAVLDDPGGSRRVFLNHGTVAGRTRPHLHLQWVSWPERFAAATAAAVRDDRESAAAEDRSVEEFPGASAWVPRAPARTAELWLAVDTIAGPAAALPRLLAAIVDQFSDAFNLVLLPELRLLRLVPRGLSECAGLELALEGEFQGIVVSTAEQAAALWRAGLADHGRTGRGCADEPC